jgi:5-hydroxyisourate hydrolase
LREHDVRGLGALSGLSTHVLDLATGRPAADVAMRLFRRSGESFIQVVAMRTDADGRARLLAAEALTAGGFRLEADIGAYFRAAGVITEEPAFLETAVVDFNVARPGGRCHVPLLASPFGYSTYRGS